MFERRGCCYKVWQWIGNIEDYEIYKAAKKEAKKVVSDVKSKAYDDLHNKLETREGKRFSDLYK